MNRKQIRNLFICLIFVTLIIFNSCLDFRRGIRVYLIEKQELRDTTIVVGDSLCLNLSDYFYLRNSTGKNEGGPLIYPSIIDTSVAIINYNCENGENANKFNTLSKKVGTTEISLYLEWKDADYTIWANATKSFILYVVDNDS